MTREATDNTPSLLPIPSEVNLLNAKLYAPQAAPHLGFQGKYCGWNNLLIC